VRALWHVGDQLVLADEEGVRLRQVDPAPARFTTAPPADHESWLRLGEQLGDPASPEAAAGADPRAMFDRQAGPVQVLPGAAARDLRAAGVNVNLAPVADVAADAGVSVQTVHARFGTKDSLFVAAWLWRVAPEGARRDTAPVGDVRAAVRILYDSYEANGDAVLLLLTQEARIPAVHQMAESGRAWHRAWVERTFAPLLAGLSGARRERRLVALVVATDLLVWKLLRREMGLDRAAAERIVIEMVTATKGAP
jgi:AcrR family transcriptional regulator